LTEENEKAQVQQKYVAVPKDDSSTNSQTGIVQEVKAMKKDFNDIRSAQGYVKGDNEYGGS